MTYPVTERTRLRRLPQRGAYDTATVHAILDEGLVCHLGFVDEGRPVTIPTAYARVGESLVVHGSSKSRTMLALARGAEVCCTVTLADALVLARSAFHHSINYRSVVVFGRAVALEDAAEKEAALRHFVERLYPGRWDAVRPPTPAELKATAVLAIPLCEASAKVRTGPPIDDEPDYALAVWAGVVALSTRRTGVTPDERLHPAIDPAAVPATALFPEAT